MAMSHDARAIIDAWNIMGGQIDWAALPVICEMLSVDDPELMITGLVILREAMRKS